MSKCVCTIFRSKLGKVHLIFMFVCFFGTGSQVAGASLKFCCWWEPWNIDPPASTSHVLDYRHVHHTQMVYILSLKCLKLYPVTYAYNSSIQCKWGCPEVTKPDHSLSRKKVLLGIQLPRLSLSGVVGRAERSLKTKQIFYNSRQSWAFELIQAVQLTLGIRCPAWGSWLWEVQGNKIPPHEIPEERWV